MSSKTSRVRAWSNPWFGVALCSLVMGAAAAGCDDTDDPDLYTAGIACTVNTQCEPPLQCFAADPDYPDTRACWQRCNDDSDCDYVSAAGYRYDFCYDCPDDPGFWSCGYEPVVCD